MAEKTDQRALAITFFMLGISMSITFAITIGVAFIGIGVPFAVLGFIFLRQGGQDEGK